MGLVSLAEVERARDVLAGVTRITPLEPFRPLSAVLGGPTWLKCETLQRAGSFKVRGAYVRIAGLAPEERARGVVAASAGNHAQGVALAARLCDAAATVYMPTGAPLPKVAATRGYGASVELVGQTVDEALVAAQEHADRTGAVFIHPFDHPDVIAGQATVGLEILEQCPEVSTIVTGVGGGGLISGIAVAVKALRPQVRVVGVQAAGVAAFPPSLRAGHPVRLGSRRGRPGPRPAPPQSSSGLPASPYATIADGIAVGCPGEVTFAHVAKLVDEIVTVSEEDISRALLMLLERSKLVVEPAGAVGVAALLADVVRVSTPVVAVLSGGNIDPLLMLRVIEHGLTSAGRYLRFTVRCVDRPGRLAALLTQIAEHGANVVDVAHERHHPGLRVGEVELALSVETRGMEHSDSLLSAMRAAGYHPSI